MFFTGDMVDYQTLIYIRKRCFICTCIDCIMENELSIQQNRTVTTLRITVPVMTNRARSDIKMGSNEISGVYKSLWQLSLNISSLKVKSKNTPV